MIFVTVGSSSIPFDRLMRAVEKIDTDERLVVQHGASTIRPRNAECIDFVDHEDLMALLRDARVAVMHAGVGSVLAARAAGKRPIIVPRCTSDGEAVDDHQAAFARRAHELGFVDLVEDVALLPTAVEAKASGSPSVSPKGRTLEEELRSYIEETVGVVPQSVTPGRA